VLYDRTLVVSDGVSSVSSLFGLLRPKKHLLFNLLV